jgi:DNA repair protein RecN (Recombination protein N)
MLRRLKISNFALVEDLELSFDAGLSVLTGETGAGKSVIVTALGLVLGDRADREHIRHGSDKATVEAEFSVERMSPHYRKQFDDYLQENAFIVEREVSRDGNARVRINGAVATLARLRELTSPLAEILGQHSSRLLLEEENHLLFLDRFAAVDHDREEVSRLFFAWERARTELSRTERKRDELERERDLLLFQSKEIEAADIRPGEESELNRERRLLDSSRALMESAALIENGLSDEENGLIDGLQRIRTELEKMAAIDESLHTQASQAQELDYQLEDLRAFIERYGGSVPDDPQRIEEINLRLDEIYGLKRKYGGSEESILAALVDIREKLADRPDTAALIARLKAEESAGRAAYTDKALQLSEVRHKAAQYLKKLVVKEMAELAIDSGQFDTEFVYEDRDDGVKLNGRTVRPYEYGLESCRFLFSANPGEPLKSLVKTASGGEISRLLLAMKAAEKKSRDLAQSLLVFDEVDAGIGGQTALEVARKIRKLSETSQVLVVTHLHQIARLADHHYLAEKTAGRGKRVTIGVTRLDPDQVLAELKRMVALPDTGRD